jgi:hypothetical protein
LARRWRRGSLSLIATAARAGFYVELSRCRSFILFIYLSNNNAEIEN